MQAAANSLDFVLSTILQPHDANPYVALVFDFEKRQNINKSILFGPGVEE